MRSSHFRYVRCWQWTTRGARVSPLPDFFIGAHAEAAGYHLLRRDTRRYRTYFPTVTLIAPE